MKYLSFLIVSLFFLYGKAEDTYFASFDLNSTKITIEEIALPMTDSIINKQLQVITHIGKAKNVIWSLHVPDSRLSGTGYGIIRNISWIKWNGSSCVYIFILRNFTSPELIFIELKDVDNKILVNDRRFPLIYLSAIDIKSVELSPSEANDTVMFDVKGQNQENFRFNLSIADGFVDIISANDFMDYPYIPSELIWLFNETYTQEQKKDFTKIRPNEIKSITAFYKHRISMPLLKFKIFFAKYLFCKLVGSDVELQSNMLEYLNTALRRQVAKQKVSVDDQERRKFFDNYKRFFMESDRLIPYEISQKNITFMLTAIYHFSCKEIIDKPIDITFISPPPVLSRRGMLDPLPPEEMERRKREFLAAQPREELFSASELKDLFIEPDYAKITDQLELARTYDWFGKYPETLITLEKTPGLEARFELGRFLKHGRPGVMANKVRANELFAKIVSTVKAQGKEAKPEDICLSGRASSEYTPKNWDETVLWRKRAAEFFQKAIEQGYRPAYYYSQYYLRHSSDKNPLELLKALPTDNLEANAFVGALAGMNRISKLRKCYAKKFGKERVQEEKI